MSFLSVLRGVGEIASILAGVLDRLGLKLGPKFSESDYATAEAVLNDLELLAQHLLVMAEKGRIALMDKQLTAGEIAEIANEIARIKQDAHRMAQEVM